MTQKLLAILLDCGDTIVDEGTEIKDPTGAVLEASLIPGAAEMVHGLKDRGYRLGLVADGPARTFHNILGHYQLLHLFDVLAISEQVGADKPDSRMFLHALNGLSIQPAAYGKVVMVGNNLERDIKGANQMGLLSVWLDWAPRRSKIPANPTEEPCYTIKNPRELFDLIPLIESSLS
ncbi:MAG: HAD family hydrolase [Anaerolineaceae bacterium]|nr:HAD family hydrolase [Anaerolineaceae bacterium]